MRHGHAYLLQTMMISETEIAGLVDAFYAKVREDPQLGSVFNAAVEDWPKHLVKLQAFWSSVMLTTGRYKGSPMAAHVAHRGAIRPEMFDRWLALWRAAAAETLEPEAAAAVTAKAERIAESLKLALYFRIAPEGRAAAA
ncbi:MAG TPA: group III truncated hemoglobin [Allosphingosinicella sp.]